MADSPQRRPLTSRPLKLLAVLWLLAGLLVTALAAGELTYLAHPGLFGPRVVKASVELSNLLREKSAARPLPQGPPGP